MLEVFQAELVSASEARDELVDQMLTLSHMGSMLKSQKPGNFGSFDLLDRQDK